MEFVNDGIFYHFNAFNGLNQHNLLDKGSIIKTEGFNPFRNSYELGVMDYEKNPIESAKAYWRFAKEYVIEQTRLNVNTELPSRWNCIWLTDEKHIEYWREYYQHLEYKLVKMKVTGKIFRADAHWIEIQPIPFEEVKERANYYWRGDIFRPGKMEIMFEGIAEVIDVEEYFVPDR